MKLTSIQAIPLLEIFLGEAVDRTGADAGTGAAGDQSWMPALTWDSALVALAAQDMELDA